MALFLSCEILFLGNLIFDKSLVLRISTRFNQSQSLCIHTHRLSLPRCITLIIKPYILDQSHLLPSTILPGDDCLSFFDGRDELALILGLMLQYFN